MKTLTVTFFDNSNYGANFQMYALNRTIRQMGHENIVLDFAGHNETMKKKHTIFKSPKVFIRNIVLAYYYKIRKKEVRDRIQSFRDFKKNNIEFTRRYTSMDDLRNDPPRVDCMITGSDQVWNMTTNPPMIPSRFLDFGNKNAIRFAFAASIENMQYTEQQKEYAKMALASFKGITLREESACRFIESITGFSAQHLMDPVFLLDNNKWLSIAKKPRITGPYILCYQVLRNSEMQSVVNTLKKQTGLPTVAICNMPFRWIKTDYSFYDVSPEEFLGLYNDAAYIVTTSFHGTAFGVVFNKPTYTLCRNISSNRIEDLMNFVGLSDFVVKSGDSVTQRKINWDEINEKLEKERTKSKQYLQKMLSE